MLILAVGIYNLPPVRSRLAWRVAELRSRIFYALNPPEEAIFLPEEQAIIEALVQATLINTTPEISPSPTLAGQTRTPASTPTPTITPTPLPQNVFLKDVVYVHQHGIYNYCSPANLAMALKYWGWEGTRNEIGLALKPGPDNPDMDYLARSLSDKNVMPYEMVDYVNEQTEFRAFSRLGGDIELLKRFIANGFPVVIEKGYYEWSTVTQEIAWLGHYLFITGYDDNEQAFIVQDAYLSPGENLYVDYASFSQEWRYFNYVFMLVYPPESEIEVFELLGPWDDTEWAAQHALDTANDEITYLTDGDEFFAWFNKGASHANLGEYDEAKGAFDYAFILYNNLGTGSEQRPYRLMWYRTEPYWAYYYSGSYESVIDLADITLYGTIASPTLEESFYWRGRANEALGDQDRAILDYREAVYLNPNFAPAINQLESLGLTP